MKSGDKPGKFVAICNKGDFDGHYVKVFEYPQSFVDEWRSANQYLNLGSSAYDPLHVPSAEWYFLNRVDGVACVEGVYPIEIFLDRGFRIALRDLDCNSKVGS